MLATLERFCDDEALPLEDVPGLPVDFLAESVRARIRRIEARLNAPQLAFVRLAARYPAIVGGYGCVAAGTQIMTIEGPRPVEGITHPTLVLSWSENQGRFLLSPSGGAFPKGRAMLYRVATQQGEFVAAGHHHVLCADGMYRRVDMLAPSDRLIHCADPGGSLSAAGSLLPEGAHRWMRTVADSMSGYADAARRYGQRLRQGLDGGQFAAPLPDGAPGCDHACAPAAAARPDGREGPAPSRNRHDRSVAHSGTGHSLRPAGRPAAGAAHLPAAAPAGRIFAAARSAGQSPSRTGSRRPGPGCGASYRLDHEALLCSNYKTTIIIQVEPVGEGEFYDLQVADTNNYVTIDGTVHHNSGKSHALCVWLLTRKFRYPRQSVAYYMPTYDLIRMIGRPRIIELLEQWEIPYRENKVENRIHIANAGDVIFRNMDRPERIVGYETADAVIDELDTLPLSKAQEVWRKIIARNRQKKPNRAPNQIGIGTTPEGFRFTYQRWSKAPTAHHAIVHASTYANAHNLPDDYIQSLIDDYPPELLAAYLEGQFVNLAQGRVYSAYERQRCATDRRDPKPWKFRQGGRLLEAGDELHIGMDFNVQKMAAVVGLDCRPGAKGLDIIDEFANLRDTPAMIEAIKARYPIADGRERLEGWPANRIIIYPDASSKNTSSTNASSSDLALLKQAGFRVRIQPANPRIKDRVISVNAAFARPDDDERRCRVNPDTCPVLVEALENQPYTATGEPDKTLGYDHIVEGLGYLIFHRVPVRRREASHTWLQGG